MRILVVIILAVLTFTSCNNDSNNGGDPPNIRYRIIRVSSTIANQTPGDYLIVYDDMNRLQFVYDEGRVLDDGRIEMWEFDWNNSRLNSVIVSAVSTDTIPVETYNYNYSGATVSAIERIRYDEDGNIVGEELRTYTSVLPSYTRIDTGFVNNQQFSNTSQFSIASGLESAKIYEGTDVLSKSTNVQLTYAVAASNPILSFGIPTSYLPIIPEMFGLELSEMPDIMFESNLLPSKILILSEGDNGSSNEEYNWTFIGLNRVEFMEAEDRSIEIEWGEY